MASTMSKYLWLIQLLAFSIYFYSIYFQHFTNIPLLPGYPPQFRVYGKLKYLTYWDLLLQFGFFTLILLNNLLKIKTLTRFLDLIFFAWVLPMSMIVSSVFWSIYAIDRELIFPRKIEPYYPPWLNHSTHTLIVVFAFMELIWGKHKQPSNRSGLMLLNLLLLTYNIWSLFLYVMHDIWVYPFLALFNWPMRIIFMLSTFVSNYAIYQLGIWCNQKFGGENQSSISGGKFKKVR